jgi:hypothetical protein
MRWRMKEQRKWRGGTAGWRLRAEGRVPGEGRVGVLIRTVCTDLLSPKPKDEAALERQNI